MAFLRFADVIEFARVLDTDGEVRHGQSNLVKPLKATLPAHPSRSQIRQDVRDGYLMRASPDHDRPLNRRLGQHKMVTFLTLCHKAVSLKDSHRFLIENWSDSAGSHIENLSHRQ
jgi:hypothetical protein